MALLVYTDEEKAILASGSCSFAGLVRIGSGLDVSRIWTGVGDIVIDRSTYDFDGTTYNGAGRLIDLPAFQRMVNGIAERVTYKMNNVTDAMRSLAYDNPGLIKDAPVRLGLVVLDSSWQQVGDVRWIWRGRIDSYETINTPGKNGERVKSIEFSIGSYFTGRKVPGQGTWTNADQQSRPGSEDDRFCERTPLMSANITKRFQ